MLAALTTTGATWTGAAATRGIAPGDRTMVVPGVGVTVPVGVVGPAPEAPPGPEGSRFIGFGLMRAIIGLPCCSNKTRFKTRTLTVNWNVF